MEITSKTKTSVHLEHAGLNLPTLAALMVIELLQYGQLILILIVTAALGLAFNIKAT